MIRDVRILFLMYFTPLSSFFLLSMSELFDLLYSLQEREARGEKKKKMAQPARGHQRSLIRGTRSLKQWLNCFPNVNRHYIFSFTFAKNREATARK